MSEDQTSWRVVGTGRYISRAPGRTRSVANEDALVAAMKAGLSDDLEFVHLVDPRTWGRWGASDSGQSYCHCSLLQVTQRNFEQYLPSLYGIHACEHGLVVSSLSRPGGPLPGQPDDAGSWAMGCCVCRRG